MVSGWRADVTPGVYLDLAGGSYVRPETGGLTITGSLTDDEAQHPMDAHRADSQAMFARGQSADVVEGVTSFLEKRPARFTDRVSDGLPSVLPEWAHQEW